MWSETPFFFQLTIIAVISFSLGSFLNVCIYRMPRNLSISLPRSYCPKCATPIAWYFNIPIFSFLLLQGRCHQCREKISPRYFIVELLTGFLLISLYFKSLDFSSPILYFLFFSIFILGLILASFIDLEFSLIPDTVSLGGIPIGIVACLLNPSLMEETSPLWGGAISLFSGLFGFSLLIIVGFLGKIIFKKEAMGMGDIKLMGMIGTFLGIKKVCLALFFGSVVGSLTGLILIARGNAQWQSQIPFGPYLALGALFSLFFGDPLWNWYFKF